MDINFDLFRIFCEVVGTGNFTKAAEKLYVSQSAVSQAIKQLEDKIGGALFNRSVRGVALTAEGEMLYSYTSKAVALIENAQTKFASMKGLRDGEIKIGASDTACGLFLLPHLSKFNTEYPEIYISVTNRTTRELIELLKNGSVDMSFINLPAEIDPTLNVKPVMEIHDCFVTGAKYAYLAESALHLRELRKYPILMLEKGSNSRQQMEKFLASYGVGITPAIELGSLNMLSEFAKIGLGIAATIREDVQKQIESGELYELRFFEQLPVRHIGLAEMKNVSLSFAAQAFKGTVLSSAKL